MEEELISAAAGGRRSRVGRETAGEGSRRDEMMSGIYKVRMREADENDGDERRVFFRDLTN